MAHKLISKTLKLRLKRGGEVAGFDKRWVSGDSCGSWSANVVELVGMWVEVKHISSLEELQLISVAVVPIPPEIGFVLGGKGDDLGFVELGEEFDATWAAKPSAYSLFF